MVRTMSMAACLSILSAGVAAAEVTRIHCAAAANEHGASLRIERNSAGLYEFYYSDRAGNPEALIGAGHCRFTWNESRLFACTEAVQDPPPGAFAASSRMIAVRRFVPPDGWDIEHHFQISIQSRYFPEGETTLAFRADGCR